MYAFLKRVSMCSFHQILRYTWSQERKWRIATLDNTENCGLHSVALRNTLLTTPPYSGVFWGSVFSPLYAEMYTIHSLVHSKNTEWVPLYGQLWFTKIHKICRDEGDPFMFRDTNVLKFQGFFPVGSGEWQRLIYVNPGWRLPYKTYPSGCSDEQPSWNKHNSLYRKAERGAKS